MGETVLPQVKGFSVHSSTPLGSAAPVVLSVEDDAGSRFVRTHALRAAGFDVIEAATGADALALADERRPSAIVLDLHLPDIDGLEVCHRLKSAPKTAAIPVLLVSASGEVEHDLPEASGRRCDAYLRDPVDSATLVATVELLVRAQGAARREMEERLRQALAEAEEARRLLDAVMEHIPMGITIADGPDLVIRRMSAYGQQLTGKRHDELAGVPVEPAPAAWEVYHTDGVRRAAPEELPLTRATRHGEVVAGEEWLIRRKDEPDVPVLCTAAPIRDREGRINGGVIAWQDISQRKRHEEVLRESEQRYHALFESMQEGFVLADIICDASGKPVDWRYVDVNPAFEAMFGRTRAETVGNTYRDLFPAAPWDDWVAALGEVALTGRPARLEPHANESGRIYRAIAYSPRAGQFAAIFTDVTERRQAQQELERQRRQYETLAEHAPEVIVRFDAGMRHVYINDYGARVYGLPKREILGKTNADLGFPADKVRFWQAQFDRVLATGQQQTVDFEFDSPNLGHQYLSALFVPEADAAGHVATVLVITRDVTPIRHAEEVLRASERQAKMVIENLAEGLVVIDPEAGTLYWNRAALALHGYQTQDHSLNRLEDTNRIFELRTPDGRLLPCDEWPVERLLRGESVRDYELAIRDLRRDWERIFSYSSAMVRDESGQPWLGLLTIRDVTERRRTEERLRQAQKLESIGLLAGGIAHDFNNLLTGIIGNASLVLDRVSGESVDRIREVMRSAERAAHLTQQLLAYAGKGQFVLRDIDISQAVQETSDLLQFSIARNVELVLNVQKRLPVLRMDPIQLQQILMNLVINAAEAIGEGNAGKITVSTSVTDLAGPLLDVTGQEVPAGRYVRVEVRDTGSGIEEENRSRIFDPFFTTKFAGRGLGLAAVAGIVRAQRGAITLESAPGQGSTFGVLLPVAERSAYSAGERPGERGRSTVLVVDDEPAVREFIAAVLGRRGYRVLTAGDGRDALGVWEREGGRIDAVLLDIVMPVMDAKELLPRIKAGKPDLKILLTSGYSEMEARRLCAEYPDAAFIQKPYSSQQIVQAMDALMGLA